MSENTEETKLTVAEQTLTYLLATDAAVRAADIARANRLALDEGEMRAMAAKFTRVTADVVLAMRALEKMPNREEFDQMLTEIATSVLANAVGPQPTDIVH